MHSILQVRRGRYLIDVATFLMYEEAQRNLLSCPKKTIHMQIWGVLYFSDGLKDRIG